MAVPQYGSTAHGRAAVRQHGVRQCGSAAVRQKVYCERHTAILVYGRKREVYGALHTTYGSTAYSVWRTAVRRTVAHRGGGRTGRTAYGTRHTAWCTVHGTQPWEQGSDTRQQGIRSIRSIPGSKEQTNKQFRSQFRSRSRSQRSRGQGLVSGEPDPYDQSNSDQSCPGNAVLPYAVLPYYNTAVCRTAVLAYCRTPYCRAPFTICRTPY